MANDENTQEPPSDPAHAPERFGKISPAWRKVVAIFLIIDIIGLWIFALRLIQHTPVRARWLRLGIVAGSLVLTMTGIVLENYVIPGVVIRAAKKIALFLIIALVALYVFAPAIDYFRGEDDMYLASIGFTDGRTLRDAKKVAGTLRMLDGNQKACRIEITKRDVTRLLRRSHKVQILQSPAQRYRVERIHSLAPGMPDRRIEQMIFSVSSDSLLRHIQMLERFGTRAEYTPQVDSAADYIVSTMKGYGLEVESLPFDRPQRIYVDETSSRIASKNICGTLRGTGPSNAECIIVGHFDSVRQGPGGNDNASGVAAVLEAARIFSGFSFTHTIRFLAVGAEEMGLIGSYHYARDAKAHGRNIIAVVNGDMLGYPVVGDPKRLVVVGGINWSALMDSALVYNRRYHLNFLIDAGTSNIGGSDHESFLRAGYPAVEVSEGTALEIWHGMDPYYHSRMDTSDKLNPDLLRHCAQLMTAITAEMAQPIKPATRGQH